MGRFKEAASLAMSLAFPGRWTRCPLPSQRSLQSILARERDRISSKCLFLRVSFRAQEHAVIQGQTRCRQKHPGLKTTIHSSSTATKGDTTHNDNTNERH